MHVGVILPNYGSASSPAEIRRVAELAVELGYDSIWTTEHIIVGPEGVDPYGRVYDPLVTLGWLAGLTPSRSVSAPSIVLAPLHNPIHLAKEVATLQELSGGRLVLGLGLGWHRDEFEFMVCPSPAGVVARTRRSRSCARSGGATLTSTESSGRFTTRHRSLIRRRRPRSGSAVALTAQSGGRSSRATRGIPHAAPASITCAG